MPQDTPIKYYYDRAFGSDGIIPKLYKFYSIKSRQTQEYNQNLLETLSLKYLWHSNPSEFNDPFDCYEELIDYSNPSEEAIMELLTPLPLGSRRERRKEQNKHIKNSKPLSHAFKSNTPKQGICCFTKNESSNTMWSHYSNCHTGLALVFDHKQLWNSGLVIAKVTYESDFKRLRYFEQKEEAIMAMFTTKSKEWAYEEEYRSLNDKFGKVKFNQSCLVGIIFGCKTPPLDITYIRNHILTAGYNDLEWSQAKMQKNSFNLLIEPLK